MSVGTVFQADSATKLLEEHRGNVVICGSHGGTYPAFRTADAGVRAVILSDAGVGRDQAGIACLDYCQRLGMAAATCSHDSARIGNAKDMAARGRISHVNRIAAGLGCVAGQRVADAAERLRDAPHKDWDVPAYEEARLEIGGKGDTPRIICLDSVGLVTDDDAGQIVMTGSHGGLMGGQPEAALKVDALAAFFNDAGIGVDQAGLVRLRVLQRRGIIAATVQAMSARIGDGRSTYEDGIISKANDRARAHGIMPDISAKDAVNRLLSSA